MHSHLFDLLRAAVQANPDRIATREWVEDQWVDRTYAQFARDIDATAREMIAGGIAPGDRIAIFSANCPTWSVIDFAALSIGAVVVPIYQTSTPEQAAAILHSCRARWVYVGSAVEESRIDQVRDRVGAVERVIRMDLPEVGTAHHGTGASGGQDATDLAERRAVNLAERRAVNLAERRAVNLAERRAAVARDQLATLIYTSGTTGEPKGVMLTHGAFLAEIAEVRRSFDLAPEDSSLCFLPLSHALERAWTFCVLSVGAMNVYVTDTRDVAAMMARARTSLMVAVPKLYARVMDGAREKVADSPLRSRLFDWAVRTGRASQLIGAERLARRPWLRARLALADALVLSKVRDAVGGQKKLMVAGGAPIRREVEEFFWSCGMIIHTGYGMTEAAPLMTYNTPESVRFGSVGTVMPGAQLRIVPTPEVTEAGAGEIQFRGPNVMLGYWENEEATAEAFDGDWLRTGDIGHLDGDGNLYITDRLKDLIVTEQGKNIAPAPIEEELGADPMIAHAVLVGDDRPCVTVLISPDTTELQAWADAHEIAYQSDEDLFAHPDLLDEIRRRVERVSARLPKQEKIRDMQLVLGEFSPSNGLLTPTLKVRRRAVERWYADKVEEMYARIEAARASARAAAEQVRASAKETIGQWGTGPGAEGESADPDLHGGAGQEHTRP